VKNNSKVNLKILVSGIVVALTGIVLISSLAGRHSPDKKIDKTGNNISPSNVVPNLSATPTATQVIDTPPIQTDAVATESPVQQKEASQQATTPPVAVAETPILINPYTEGFNNWHVYNRRAEVGKTISRNWQNEQTIAGVARNEGYIVDTTPEIYAVSVKQGSFVAVGFVESQNADGGLVISYTNYSGWNKLVNVTVPSSELGGYLFIH
jgi:surface antigen